MKNYKVLFADLDGTLIETISGDTFPERTWDMRLKFDVLDRIKELKPELVAIVTNQGGIEKGFVDERNFVKGKMSYVTRSIEEYAGCRCIFNYCISNDKDCRFRKPNIGMLETVIHKNFNQLGIEAAKEDMLMIGDASGKEGQFSDSDKRTAENFDIDYLDVEDFVKAMKGE